MIAGTEFVLVDVYAVWPAIAARARRSRSDPEVLRELRLRCLDGSAVCLRSPEGVVILGARGTEAGGLVAEVLLAVSGEGSLHGAWVLLPHPGASLYIGEKEGDCANGQLDHRHKSFRYRKAIESAIGASIRVSKGISSIGGMNVPAL